MSLNKNQVEAIIYQLLRKLHNNDLVSWYIKNNPHDFQYLDNGELAYNFQCYGSSRVLLSLVVLENNANLLSDNEIDFILFLDLLLEDAEKVVRLADDKMFEYYLDRVENI